MSHALNSYNRNAKADYLTVKQPVGRGDKWDMNKFKLNQSNLVKRCDSFFFFSDFIYTYTFSKKTEFASKRALG